MKDEVKLDPYRRIVKKAMAEKIPLSVLWELTYKCNLSCVHCYAVGDSRRKELSSKQIESILDQLAEQGCLYVVFSGGEILTRADFFDIAWYAREKDFALRLLTNGTLITSEIADKIKELSPLSVEMSLYAANASIHEAITKSPGSYAKTISAIKLLKERGIRTVIKSPLMKKTVGEFDGLKRLAKRLGCKLVYDLTIVARNDRSKEPLRYRLTDDDLRQFLSSKVKLSGGRPEEIPDDALVCNAGLNTLSISPYGEVFPCIAIRKSCGDLSKQTFEEVWSSPVLSEIRAIRFSDLWKCRSCELLSYCDRCSGVADLEDGDILGSSTAACLRAKALRSVMKEVTSNQ